jgi:hypothetical protein
MPVNSGKILNLTAAKPKSINIIHDLRKISIKILK